MTNTAPPPGTSVLLVEDEIGTLRLLARTLANHGYIVLPASDAEAALAIEAQYLGTITLLVSDVMLPGLGGPALAQRLQARLPSMRVLFMSGHAEQANARLRGLPNAQLLLKPFKIEAFMTAVQRALLGGNTSPPTGSGPRR